MEVGAGPRATGRGRAFGAASCSRVSCDRAPAPGLGALAAPCAVNCGGRRACAPHQNQAISRHHPARAAAHPTHPSSRQPAPGRGLLHRRPLRRPLGRRRRAPLELVPRGAHGARPAVRRSGLPRRHGGLRLDPLAAHPPGGAPDSQLLHGRLDLVRPAPPPAVCCLMSIVLDRSGRSLVDRSGPVWSIPGWVRPRPAPPAERREGSLEGRGARPQSSPRHTPGRGPRSGAERRATDRAPRAPPNGRTTPPPALPLAARAAPSSPA